MFLDQLNLNQIRIFENVYRTRSMTEASRELHLTQSGVSQHIKSLEDVLGFRLFDRIKHRLVPTPKAAAFYLHVSQGLLQIEHALVDLKGDVRKLTGIVSIGMPIEFGNNLVLPLLSKFGQKHPDLRFRLKFDFASVMNQMLLEGELDFAFVDSFTMDRSILTTAVYDEVIELCVSEKLLDSMEVPRTSKKIFDALPYVEYQEGEPLLHMWFAHHFGKKHLDVRVRATIMDVQAIARLILNGLGAGVLPSYVITKLESEGHVLHKFKGCGKPLKNTISAAHLKERTHSTAALATLDWIKTNIGKDLAKERSKPA